jgi:hypothetical protein
MGAMPAMGVAHPRQIGAHGGIQAPPRQQRNPFDDRSTLRKASAWLGLRQPYQTFTARPETSKALLSHDEH